MGRNLDGYFYLKKKKFCLHEYNHFATLQICFVKLRLETTLLDNDFYPDLI